MGTGPALLVSFVGPAYGYGVDAYGKYPGRSFDEDRTRSGARLGQDARHSGLTWDRAKTATRDAWNRVSDTVERAAPGDSDRDGR